MIKKIIQLTFAASVVFASAVAVYAYTSADDGVTYDNNTNSIKNIQPNQGTTNIAAPQSSTCLDLQSTNLGYRANDYSTNGEVTRLQNFLRDLSFLNFNNSGYFGTGTFKAVRSFQGSVGISPTGFVGPMTRVKIKGLTCVTSTNQVQGNVQNNQNGSSMYVYKPVVTTQLGNSATGTELKSRPKIMCTMVASFCLDGSLMPRDSSCGWHPEQCPSVKLPIIDTNKSGISSTTTLPVTVVNQKNTTVYTAPPVITNATTAVTRSLRPQVSCLYAAPPDGCHYEAGPITDPSTCNAVLVCDKAMQ